ncbi:hypothetical protein KIN20_012615 [Parelaphostrongylus tenuis]|uniref:Uncharacterized protein n=1 Tax=Parelaphostrongylus tenuis TaxID=148309 RepID=A0AAD5MFG9_PARTN|nr:hypothetical protein KIN20_012615 [Parelaphostrongylus tenuis]
MVIAPPWSRDVSGYVLRGTGKSIPAPQLLKLNIRRSHPEAHHRRGIKLVAKRQLFSNFEGWYFLLLAPDEWGKPKKTEEYVESYRLESHRIWTPVSDMLDESNTAGISDLRSCLDAEVVCCTGGRYESNHPRMALCIIGIYWTHARRR